MLSRSSYFPGFLKLIAVGGFGCELADFVMQGCGSFFKLGPLCQSLDRNVQARASASVSVIGKCLGQLPSAPWLPAGVTLLPGRHWQSLDAVLVDTAAWGGVGGGMPSLSGWRPEMLLRQAPPPTPPPQRAIRTLVLLRLTNPALTQVFLEHLSLCYSLN